MSSQPFPSPLNTTDRLHVATMTALLSSIMGGVVARTSAGSSGRMAIQEGTREAERHRETCFTIAKQLVAINQKDYGVDEGDLRLNTVTSLFGAAVSALIGRGEKPDDALRHVNKQRDSFFLGAESIIRRTLDTPRAAPAPEARAERPSLQAWRESRAAGARLELEPIPAGDELAVHRPKLS